MYLKYDEIINRLDILKKIKIHFVISKYNDCLKQLDYAVEECLAQEKLLVSLSKINKYDIDLDNLITNIIMLPIQKHIFCISIQFNIDIPSYELNDMTIKFDGNYEIHGKEVFAYICYYMTDRNIYDDSFTGFLYQQ